MYLMAALSTYENGSKKHGCAHGVQECRRGHLSNVVTNLGSCGAMSDFELLEIDENDNSFPWGLIHHNELAHMLNNGLGKTMVIDSRSFLEFNTSNIHQSINVCCSKLVKRRLQQDKVHVMDLLNQACNVDVDSSWDVIVYDQCTEDPSQLTSDNFVQVLLNKLSTTFNSVAFLKGGFLAFQASHPGLTENKSGSHRCSTLTSLSQPCMPVSNIGPTRILPFLYLGSQQDSLNQEVSQVNGITYILNVSKTCPRPPYILESHFHRIPVNDNYCEKLLPYFVEAFQFLDKVREANGCVLVHCLGGVSRSATLAIAYIMKYMKMSSDEAYRYVKDKRPTISPNFNFLGQLLEYEKIIRKEEQLEEARREAIKATTFDDSISCETERASPGSMDLHTTSPSSPGPRTLRQTVSSSMLFKLNLTQETELFSDTTSQILAWHRRPQGLATRNIVQSPVKEVSRFSLVGCKSDTDAACFNVTSHQQTSVDIMTNICDRKIGSEDLLFAQSSVCPITGFPSPGEGVNHDLPKPTCTITGFPGPEQYGSNQLDVTDFDTKTLFLDNPAYHSNVSSSTTTLKTSDTIVTNPTTQKTQKMEQQPKIKQGLSFSSIFSNFRWKSRPPTLPLGSPVGAVKDTGHSVKKQGGDLSGGGDSRVQLTPVSEAIENCDIILTDEMTSNVSIDHKENKKMDNDIYVQTYNKSGSSHATTSIMASKVINSCLTPGSSETTISSINKSTSLKLSAKQFTLALSSPTSEFPVCFSSSSHKPLSPGDNKRKSGLTKSDFDSPDKLAKTEDFHQHTLSPPKTLNISQGSSDKLRQRTSARRSFVLQLSSPTTAMSRLNFSSPSEKTEESLWAARDESSLLQTDSLVPMEIDKSISASLFTSNIYFTDGELGRCSASQSTFTKSDTGKKSTQSIEPNFAVFPSSSQSSLSTTSHSTVDLPSIVQESTTAPVNDLAIAASAALDSFQELPTTSLDKLSFTPCFTKDIVNEFKARNANLAAREDHNEPRSSVLDSPMSISSGSSAPSLASSTISPIESNMVNPFSDSEQKLYDETTPLIHSEPHTLGHAVSTSLKQPVVSPSADFNLSPSSMPQATMSPILPSMTSPNFYSSTSSLELLSPMSITDSTSDSPKLLSKRSSLCSLAQSSASSPILSLPSPLVSSPSISPMVTSPTSSSFHLASCSSSTSWTSMTKVIRRDKSKRVIDRPYSIAFSSYPACELVPNSTKDGSSVGQTSQDDASEAYMSVSSKKSRLSKASDCQASQGRTSWSGYSEREVYNKYKEITAAMENAMMRTQVFSMHSSPNSRGDTTRATSRKARSLEDFLESNTSEREETLTFKGGNQRWKHYRESHLEPFYCGMHSTSEPYHSSSSLSSNGSHGSSLEIIQQPR
ncbi:serine-rich adhesin for platelets-like isoform X1 [Biomphalaria glabrata]|uniref:protein-tyrosine-phosphatase n=1 Tax=Biomphalaria glabrata TaxID=6526 RepID=A0A9W3ARK9_BIOGL|nr:serine-rich adhesin for platelets-like isoform X1 [Biomphalaria glabrata]XP_055889850.1 serine-rich adhesin for platelets-like isoform X1 [Biomphalaria glabrata]XP_055889851.1 serine-rich adhesin for platelets-like isoform X1 [Biomphalaria glabrata]XP_055889852.1 serine-rich adhesin for platelets-like isoform X1 [Biomphalaria glabrata]XP_055889853.1 serine-rich adhesin for platelets-like isoform X1 [Biomphalaria glabrata]